MNLNLFSFAWRETVRSAYWGKSLATNIGLGFLALYFSVSFLFLGFAIPRHPRWTFHFTPTSCSWLNAVETFFAKLTKRRLKRGVFHSLVALQTAINGFVETHNRNPKPFVWKADPNAIIAAAKRGYQALDSIH
jgi:hypothetical protein